MNTFARLRSALLPALLLLHLSATTQPVQVETLDFLSMKDFANVIFQNTESKRKHKTQMIIEIKNINRNIFKIEDSIEQKEFNTKPPELFAGVKLPTFLNFALPDEKAASAAQMPGDPSTLKSVSEFDPYFKTIKEASAVFEAAVVLNNNLANLAKTCGESYDTIASRRDGQLAAFLPAGTPATIGQVTARLEREARKAVDALNDVNALWPVFEVRTWDLEEKDRAKVKSFERQLKVTPKTKDDRLRQQIAQQNLDNLRVNLEINRRGAIKAALEKKIAAAETAVKAMQQFIADNKLQTITDNYALLNPANFTYRTTHIPVRKDVTAVKLRISTDQRLTCNVPDRYVIEREYINQGGWKADFSAGPFFNFGDADFYGRELYYEPVDDEYTKIAAKDGGTRMLLSVGALMHIYKRNGTKQHIAFSPGLSVSTKLDAFNFHLGGSVIFGRRNRLALSAGITLRETTVLDRRYEYDTTYLKKNLPENPPAINVFPRIGGFFALTYNWERLDKG